MKQLNGQKKIVDFVRGQTVFIKFTQLNYSILIGSMWTTGYCLLEIFDSFCYAVQALFLKNFLFSQREIFT